MTLAPGTPIGKYVVRRKIAEGGMAEIYLCSVRGPEGFDKEVVIKRIRPFLATDPEFVKMFVTEAQVASRLNHANVVQIFDFDKHEDTYYLAMEYVHGMSLWDVRRVCKERLVPIPPTLVAHIGSEVARGLHYAHQLTDKGAPMGLVHRDVTPHNVLLSMDGAVKLTDFGIAKAGNKLTAPGMLKGKFAYMSPEQSRGEDVDRRSDVFGLGIVLWEMLTGGKLFDGDSDVAVLRAVQQRAIPPPARLNPDVPAELDAAVMKSLERNPAARFQSCQEQERALAQFVLKNRQTLEDTDVGGFLRRLAQDEGTQPGQAEAPVIEEPVSLDPTAVARKPARALSPDEDPNADTYVLSRTAPDEPAPPRHARPTVPVAGMAEALAERQASSGASLPTDTSVLRASVGMRRGVLAAAALFVALAGAAGVVAFQARTLEAPAAVLEQVPAADAGALPAPVAAALPPVDAGSVAPVAVAATGTLLIRAAPWADVYIDGEQRGVSVMGQRQYRLSAGKHRLRFQHNLGAKDLVVNVESGKVVRRDFDAFKLP